MMCKKIFNLICCGLMVVGYFNLYKGHCSLSKQNEVKTEEKGSRFIDNTQVSSKDFDKKGKLKPEYFLKKYQKKLLEIGEEILNNPLVQDAAENLDQAGTDALVEKINNTAINLWDSKDERAATLKKEIDQDIKLSIEPSKYKNFDDKGSYVLKISNKGEKKTVLIVDNIPFSYISLIEREKNRISSKSPVIFGEKFDGVIEEFKRAKPDENKPKLVTEKKLGTKILEVEHNGNKTFYLPYEFGRLKHFGTSIIDMIPIFSKKPNELIEMFECIGRNLANFHLKGFMDKKISNYSDFKTYNHGNLTWHNVYIDVDTKKVSFMNTTRLWASLAQPFSPGILEKNRVGDLVNFIALPLFEWPLKSIAVDVNFEQLIASFLKGYCEILASSGNFVQKNHPDKKMSSEEVMSDVMDKVVDVIEKKINQHPDGKDAKIGKVKNEVQKIIDNYKKS